MSTNFHTSHTSKFLLLPLIIFQCTMTTTILAQSQAPGPTGPTNITKILEKAGQFTTLIRLMKVTQLGDQINTQLNNSNQGMTVFAPTDNAFSSMKPGALNSLSDQQKVALLQFHVVPNYLTTSELQTVSNPVRTQAGDTGSNKFPLNIISSGNQVNVSTGVVDTTVSNSIYTDGSLALKHEQDDDENDEKSLSSLPQNPQSIQFQMASENTKHLKHEQDDDENDEKSLSSLLQNKNKKPNGTGSFLSKSLSLKDAKAKKQPPKFKKEEDSDDDDDFIISRKIKKDGPPTAETKKTPSSKVKKEEAGNDSMKTPNSEVKKEKSLTSDKKQREKSSEQNGKKKEEKKKVVKGSDSSVKKEKKERKVYDLPGQKRDPPEERDPLRIFYESLYSQIPTSEMAAIWMMESGLLHKDVAKKLFEAKRKKAQQQKLGSPMKTVVTVKKQSDSSSVTVKKQSDSSSVTVKKKIVSTEKKRTPTPPSKAPTTQSKKRKIVDDTDGSSDEGSDDDFVISRKIKKPKAA